MWASVAAAHGLGSWGLRALGHRLSSCGEQFDMLPFRDQGWNPRPWASRWTRIHFTSREALHCILSKVQTSYHDLQDLAWSSQPVHISILCLISLCSFPNGPWGLLCLEPSSADPSTRFTLCLVLHMAGSFVSQMSVFTSTFLEEPSLPPRIKRVPILLLFFLTALGLHCCVQALSSCGRWEPLSSCGAGASHCGGLFSWGAWALGCQPSCPTACEIFPDQGLNWYPPHWQVNA